MQDAKQYTLDSKIHWIASSRTRNPTDQINQIANLVFQGGDVDVKAYDPEANLKTPLHYALIRRDAGMMDWLLNNGADPNRLSDSGRVAPIEEAADWGRIDVIDRLLESGADINLSSLDNGTALHTAARYGRVDLINALCQRGANPDSTDQKDGETPAMTAVMTSKLTPDKRKQVIGALINQGADITASRSAEEPSAHDALHLKGDSEMLGFVDRCYQEKAGDLLLGVKPASTRNTTPDSPGNL